MVKLNRTMSLTVYSEQASDEMCNLACAPHILPPFAAISSHTSL